MKIGFIGFGEVGYEQSMGFQKEGIEKIIAYDPMQNDAVYGATIKEKAQNSKTMLANTPQEVFEEAEIVFAAVPGKVALKVAQDSAPYFRKKTLYVDVSASAPETKRKISEVIEAKGASYVDGAMMGSLPLFKHQVPTLISGDGSDRLLKELTPYHVDMEKISDIPGDATAVKFVRSIFMKGLPSLMLEVLQAATLLQVEDLVLSSLAKTMNACSFEETFNRLVTGTAIHADRRSHEVKEVIEMLQGLAIDPVMSEATYAKHRWIAEMDLKAQFAGKTPKEWQAVVEAWKQK